MHYYDVELSDPFQMDVNFYFPEGCKNRGEDANGLKQDLLEIMFYCIRTKSL